MKRFNLLMILLFFCMTFWGQQQNICNILKLSKNESDSISCKLKIIKVKSVKKAYIIDACDIKNNYMYKIVSLKIKEKKCNKIRVDREYELVIWPYFNTKDNIPNQLVTYIIDIKGETISVPSDEWTDNIYITSDLLGLCYSHPL